MKPLSTTTRGLGIGAKNATRTRQRRTQPGRGAINATHTRQRRRQTTLAVESSTGAENSMHTKRRTQRTADIDWLQVPKMSGMHGKEHDLQ